MSHMWTAAVRNVQSIERRRQRNETTKAPVPGDEDFEDKAATYIQDISVVRQYQYAGIIAERVATAAKEKLEQEKAKRLAEADCAAKTKAVADRIEELERVKFATL